MSSLPPSAGLKISHVDFLVLIAHQAQTVAQVASAITQGRDVGPESLIVSTNRLTELVSHWVASVQPVASSSSEKAA